MAQTVKQFVTDAYQLISANSPTTPLKGDDFSKGLQFLNELLSSYSGTGLMITVSKEVTTPIIAGQLQVTEAAVTFTQKLSLHLLKTKVLLLVTLKCRLLFVPGLHLLRFKLTLTLHVWLV